MRDPQPQGAERSRRGIDGHTHLVDRAGGRLLLGWLWRGGRWEALLLGARRLLGTGLLLGVKGVCPAPLRPPKTPPRYGKASGPGMEMEGGTATPELSGSGGP